MNKNYTHTLYLVDNNEYYISKYDVLGTWDDTDENWEAFFKRTYPELSDKIFNEIGKKGKFKVFRGGQFATFKPQTIDGMD